VHTNDERPIQPKYDADLSFPGTNGHGIVFAGGTYNWTPPTILDMNSVLAGENAFISVKAEDDAGNIHTVVIAYTNGDGVWSSTSLLKDGSGWSGSFPAKAETTFFVQAVDEAGNVAFDDNSGLYFEPGDGSLDVYPPLVLKLP
jgi:hypothetical protein